MDENHPFDQLADGPAPTDIPEKQWLPGWIRWPVRVLLFPWVWLDIFAQKCAAKIIRPPYRQEGHCLKRGNCCRYILIPETKGLLGRLHFFYNTQIQGFFPRYTDHSEKIIVMGCRYLQKDGSCKHHKLRPVVCRKWPQIEYFGKPRILKGCGFKAIPRAPFLRRLKNSSFEAKGL